MTDLLRQMGRAAVLAIMLGMTLSPQSAWAVQPDEILDDPVLEQRARDLSKGLRCLVCRNENIDDSNAELARDLRLLVRERLLAGDTDDEAIDFITDRYGEYVLLNPRTGGSNWVLWAAGPVMLITGLGIGLIYLRRRSRATETALSQDEEARLKEILDR
ncbi:cytochrome c-type biogenesis protein CcmH [Pseudooceanicola nitratireducens]|jgi:cytochrome c-type biogenesis protein CcmH